VVWISVLAGALAVAVGVIVWQRLEAPQVAPDLPLRKWVLAPTNSLNIGSPVISPSGRSIAYLTGNPRGSGPVGASNRRLWVWQLGQNEPRELASLGAGQALAGFCPFFWSPGDDFIAFTSGRELRKVAVQGGNVTLLCQIPEGFFNGGAWAPDGNSIVFTTAPPNRLYELSAQGGNPRVLIDSSVLQESADTPHFLPTQAGSRILLLSTKGQILLHNLGTGQRRVLGNGHRPVYAPSGHVVFEKAMFKDEIWALPFSLERLEPTGEAFPVAKNAQAPSVARDGTLVYLQPALAQQKQLIWRNRDGRKLAEIGQPQKQILLPSLSPDGQFVGVEGIEEATGEDVWIHGVARSTKTRLTLDPARDSRAIWSPDGKEIAFLSTRGEGGMFTISADGQTKPIVIDGKPVRGGPEAWSPDGKYLVYDFFWNLCWLERKPGSSGWATSTCGQNTFPEGAGSFSPDGRFLAYCSGESGTSEVYVRPFPEGRKVPISANGGAQPRWRRDGSELFWVEGETLMATSVSTTPTFSMGATTKLFSDVNLDWSWALPAYDVSADGQRFVLTEPSGTVRNATIQVVQNWIAEFKR
jgi:eukaryotic-like serine/threonine-protein kinase